MGKNKDPLGFDSKKKKKNKQNKFDEFITEVAHECTVVGGLGLCEYGRLLKHRYFAAMPATAAAYLGCYHFAENLYHIAFLRLLFPEILPLTNFSWISNFPLWQQALALFLCLFFPIVIVLGIRQRYMRTKYQKLFERCGLTNKHGEAPVLLKRRVADKYREQLVLDTKGIGINHFNEKVDDVEAGFRKAVESINHGDNQGIVTITLTSKKLPDRITFQEILAETPLPANSFYIGYSLEGPQVQDISELPHMLIAGATGGGKSVFFKQVLVGLLSSCEHLQMYLLDLKGGLEMADFVAAPNVTVIKEMSKAVSILRRLEKEMKDRFDYLEKNGYKEINPRRDKKERIIVAVDESSVLFTTLAKIDRDHDLAQEARKLLDSLSKLSRAAGINIILATQKLDKQVLPTSVSENISGRMAFKANSLQGSLLVIGSKDAMDLPEIKGRGIWNFGSQKVIVQAPYIGEQEIKNYCEVIKQEYADGHRKMFNGMLQPIAAEAGKKQTDIAVKHITGKGNKA